VLVVDRGLAETRAKAQALILAGEVFVGDVRIEKPGSNVSSSAELRLVSRRRFVSRGGDKLDGALDDLAALDLPEDQQLVTRGVRALDVGASTGGFTDCLLQRGAAHVVAVDVGYGQLAAKLRDDGRVTVLERTNARDLEADGIGGPVDLVVVDASFIGIGLLIEAIARVLVPGGALVALIKPQFEAGREAVNRGRGVIRDEAIRQEAIDRATSKIVQAGFDLLGGVDSRVHGPKGNVERFVFARSRPR